ncbi:MAG: hypothetical protein LBF77_04130 [Spirochaetaceae bacterium]|jgi:hypothetical protein|nr:hypothetical protein [Spirochaetaceae bacterium]
MNKKTWDAFTAARERYKAYIDELSHALPELRSYQQALVDSRAGPSYTVETPVLYNFALDELTRDDEIRLILVADNPGRREQAEENRRYLVGPSGKIAERFFREHPELGVDFRKQVIILNKTPIHTPRTAELRELCATGGPSLARAASESQRFMAALLAEFQRALACVPVWITGYSEMKKGGIFEAYTEALKNRYPENLRGRIFLYRHFSMNQFTVDLHRQAAPEEPLRETLERIGRAYRRRILGW